MSLSRTHFPLLVASLALFTSLANAKEPPEGISGEGELGWVTTSGNTNTRSINAKLKVNYLSGLWRQEGRLEGMRTSQGDSTLAERYLVSGKSDYRFRPHDYVFMTVRYEDDRFSGYEYQFSEAMGYGHRTVDRETVTLDMEIGAGGRHSREIGAERRDEAIARAAAKLRWALSPTARFSEDLLVESGESNTYSESVSALTVKINSHFATRLSLTAKHNSSVPAGIEHTDVISAAALVYDF